MAKNFVLHQDVWQSAAGAESGEGEVTLHKSIRRMKAALLMLNSRNAGLYYFGLVCLVGAIICAGLFVTTDQQLLGINVFAKPMKFYASIWLFSWTMAWILPLLGEPRKATAYTGMVIAVMTFELVVITAQAVQGKLSHFNLTSSVDARLFDMMGVAITVLTGWTAYIGYLFFRHQYPTISPAYLWGIRLGILLFVVFGFEGFLMAIRLGHTVGAADGGPGLPVINWSVRHGDLRIAHFFGMHALQLLPLFGYYVARRPRQVIAVALVYFLFVTGMFIQAVLGYPLLRA